MAEMKRLLHFALLIFAFALYGISVNIISGVMAKPALKEELASEPVPAEPELTTTTSTTVKTTVHDMQLSTTSTTVRRIRTPTTARRTAVLPSTTTTTEALKTPLEVAQSQVGRPARTLTAGSGWLAG
jgi:hypothetical protein